MRSGAQPRRQEDWVPAQLKKAARKACVTKAVCAWRAGAPPPAAADDAIKDHAGNA